MGANAQTSVPTFTAGDVLTAANMNISARTGVPVFASTVTRDAAFGGTGEKTLAEGQMCYVEGTGFQTYNGTAWVTWGTAPSSSAVVQVKSTAKTDAFTLAGTTTPTDVTGLSVSITPTSASNRVLVIAQITAGAAAGTNANLRLVRDSTAIYLGDAAGSRIRIGTGDVINVDYQVSSNSIVFLDSPATTSATTYKIQMYHVTGQGALYVNRTNTDTDSASFVRAASSITVMEVTP